MSTHWLPLRSPQPVGPVSMGPRLSALSATAQSTYTAKQETKKQQRRNGESDGESETGRERAKEREKWRGGAFIKSCPSFQKPAVVSSVFCPSPSPSQLLVLLAARANQWRAQPDFALSCFKIVLFCLFRCRRWSIYCPGSPLLVLNVNPCFPWSRLSHVVCQLHQLHLHTHTRTHTNVG